MKVTKNQGLGLFLSGKRRAIIKFYYGDGDDINQGGGISGWNDRRGLGPMTLS